MSENDIVPATISAARISSSGSVDALLQGKLVDGQIQAQQMGWLGRIFGNNDRTNTHYVGFAMVVLLLAGVGYMFFAPANAAFTVAECWKAFLPIITSMLGYFIGASQRPKSET